MLDFTGQSFWKSAFSIRYRSNIAPPCNVLKQADRQGEIATKRGFSVLNPCFLLFQKNQGNDRDQNFASPCTLRNTIRLLPSIIGAGSNGDPHLRLGIGQRHQSVQPHCAVPAFLGRGGVDLRRR
jgi:hypothetical protein